VSATRFVTPPSVAEVVEVLGRAAADGEEARIVAGGTALMLLTKYGFYNPELLVSLRGSRAELLGVSHDAAGMTVGALVTLADLQRASGSIGLNGLRMAAGQIANPRIRSVATLGGHLAHADPHMDLPPALLAFEAMVTVTGRHGVRGLQIDELITGYYETSLTDDEVITAMRVPPTDEHTRSVYLKHTARSADDWPAVGVAAVARRDGKRLLSVTVALGAVESRPRRLTAVEGHVLATGGAHLDARREAAELAVQGLEPLADLHGSADYKAEMVRVHVRRALDSVLGGR